MIKNRDAAGFCDRLRFFTAEQCAVVCDIFKPQLLRKIKSELAVPASSHRPCFFDRLMFLNPEQRTAIYHVLQEDLPNMIRSPQNFNTVVRHFTVGQSTAIFHSVKDRLLLMINSANDLKYVLKSLTPDQCSSVCSSL